MRITLGMDRLPIYSDSYVTTETEIRHLTVTASGRQIFLSGGSAAIDAAYDLCQELLQELQPKALARTKLLTTPVLERYDVFFLPEEAFGIEMTASRGGCSVYYDPSGRFRGQTLQGTGLICGAGKRLLKVLWYPHRLGMDGLDGTKIYAGVNSTVLKHGLPVTTGTPGFLGVVGWATLHKYLMRDSPLSRAISILRACTSALSLPQMSETLSGLHSRGIRRSSTESNRFLAYGRRHR